MDSNTTSPWNETICVFNLNECVPKYILWSENLKIGVASQYC
jgi:hypothetical protein